MERQQSSVSSGFDGTVNLDPRRSQTTTRCNPDNLWYIRHPQMTGILSIGANCPFRKEGDYSGGHHRS